MSEIRFDEWLLRDWASNPWWPSGSFSEPWERGDFHEYLYDVVIGGQHDADCGDMETHGRVWCLVADAVCVLEDHDPDDHLDYENHFGYELFETEQAARQEFRRIERELKG
jgi:hypothetical protein